MSFRNSYISTFNPVIRNKKKFLKVFFLSIVFSYLSALVLNRLNLKITNNDIILDYQLKKINNNEFNKVDTLFIGDSTGGNAINSDFFNSISKLNSENLSLTGSFGISGSLGILKKAFEQNSNLKNIIIIHTLDIWNRPFSKNAILLLFPFMEMYKYLDYSSVFSHFFNLREISWNLKYFKKKILNDKTIPIIDTQNDYMTQGKKKFSNKKLQIDSVLNLDGIEISEGKSKEMKMLDNFCKNNNLNCLFLNGPILKESFVNGDLLLKTKINERFSYIKYFPRIFQYDSYMIGDSSDHIDPRYKNTSTNDIYNHIKNYLK